MNTTTRSQQMNTGQAGPHDGAVSREWRFLLVAIALLALPAAIAQLHVSASTSAAPARVRGAGQAKPQALAQAAQAQGPRLTNADERRVAASGALDAQIRTLAQQQSDPFWIAMVQPSARPRMDSCCYSNDNGNWSRGGNSCCGMCRLEKENESLTRNSSGDKSSPASPSSSSSAAAADTPIKLEGSQEFVVLARIAQQQVERVRMFSPDCALDAGGLRVYMITGVAPSASIAWLESLVRAEASAPSDSRETRRRGERLSGGAIAAIAMHRDPAADAALDRLVAPGRPRQQRRDAAFWLANARGPHGYEVVRKLARDESELELRKHAVFCLTITEHPAAVDELLALAKNASHPEVRGQALFWVAQTAGKRAVSTLTDAIANDPETEVKERAVFALSQLPNKEGTPLLIEVAKTHKNPQVRKKAMFWLGQSKDPRALEFFESILK